MKDDDGDTPLHIACLKGHTDIVKLLLKKGTDVTVARTYGHTSLHVACLKGHTDIPYALVTLTFAPLSRSS
jgi:ankyrin repeat protein